MRLPALRLARLTPVALPLTRALATGRGPISERAGVVLELEGKGHVGLGEALPLPGFGLEEGGCVGKAIEAALGALAVARPTTLAAALDRVEEAIPSAASARACLDVALHDLASRGAGRPLAQALGARRRRVAVAALITSSDADEAAREARERVAAGVSTLKLKLGGRALAADLARVEAVRRAAGPRAELRLDANQAWCCEEASRAVRSLAAFSPAFLEEPLAEPTPHALAALRCGSRVPIAVDESLRDPSDALALCAAGAVDVLVVKPMAVGGLRAAGRILACARSHELRAVVTHFLDSAIGVAAALALAATLPEAWGAAGLVHEGILSRDLARLPPPIGGVREVPEAPGLGPTLDRGALAAVATGPTREIALA